MLNKNIEQAEPSGLIYQKVKKYIWEKDQGLYAGDREQFEKSFYDKIDVEFSAGLLKEVTAATGFNAGSMLLDIGCGFGTFVLCCRQNGLQALGVDPDAREIEFARERLELELGKSAIEVYRVSRGESLSFAAETFDVVTMWNLLEHVPDYKSMLNEAHRVLKKGGYLLLLAPNYLSFRKEAHFHLPWFPLLPRKIAQGYLKIMKRDVNYFQNNIFYVTGIGVSSYLLKKKYQLGCDKLAKLQDPALAQSAFKAKLVRGVKAAGLAKILKYLIFLEHFNPFKVNISICARKNAKDGNNG